MIPHLRPPTNFFDYLSSSLFDAVTHNAGVEAQSGRWYNMSRVVDGLNNDPTNLCLPLEKCRRRDGYRVLPSKPRISMDQQNGQCYELVSTFGKRKVAFESNQKGPIRNGFSKIFYSVDVKFVLDRQSLLGAGLLPEWLRNLALGGHAMVSLDTYRCVCGAALQFVKVRGLIVALKRLAGLHEVVTNAKKM